MTVDTQGVIACSRYSFAPNSLHFCGPERQNDMLAYVKGRRADNGLVEILHRFETLYPYLVLIASENHIQDPFDRQVVEAYWLGNTLLDGVKTSALAAHLTDTFNLKAKVKKKHVGPMMNPIVESGVPQHNSHVLNIFVRTGHHAVPHTLSTMDQCRVSWGKVVETGSRVKGQGSSKEIGKPCIVETQPLMYGKGKFILGVPQKKAVTSVSVHPKMGEWVSIHWGYVCDILTHQQRMHLAYYTHKALDTANRSQLVSRI